MAETPQSKGGNARAKALSPEARSDIAKQGAAARWQDKPRRYFVSVHREGKGTRPLAGPYLTHQEALDRVREVRHHACALDVWADFDSFGTMSTTDPAVNGHPLFAHFISQISA